MDNINKAAPSNSHSPTAYRRKLAARYKLTKIMPFLLLSLLISVYFSYAHYQTKQQTYKLQQDNIIEATKAASKQLDVLVSEVVTTADNLALKMSSLMPTERTNIHQLDAMLTNILLADHNFHGASISFKPFAFKQDKKLFARYISRQNQQVLPPCRRRRSISY